MSVEPERNADRLATEFGHLDAVDMRLVFRLLRGMSYAEIARRERCDERTVRAWWRGIVSTLPSVRAARNAKGDR